MRLLSSAPRCRCRLNSNVRLHTKHPTPRLQCRGFLTVLTTQSCHSNAAQERGDCHHRVVLILQLDGLNDCSAWLAQTLQPGLPSWLLTLKVAAKGGAALSAYSKGQIQARGARRRRGVPRLLLLTGSMSARMALMQTCSAHRGPPVQPNPSFKPSPNSVARQPSSAGPAAHFALAVRRATLLVPA